jgi:hypothetical protein
MVYSKECKFNPVLAGKMLMCALRVFQEQQYYLFIKQLGYMRID